MTAGALVRPPSLAGTVQSLQSSLFVGILHSKSTSTGSFSPSSRLSFGTAGAAGKLQTAGTFLQPPKRGAASRLSHTGAKMPLVGFDAEFLCISMHKTWARRHQRPTSTDGPASNARNPCTGTAHSSTIHHHTTDASASDAHCQPRLRQQANRLPIWGAPTQSLSHQMHPAESPAAMPIKGIVCPCAASTVGWALPASWGSVVLAQQHTSAGRALGSE